LTDNAVDVINSDADIVLELIGGTTFAKELVEKSLKKGKHVITANKALIATYGNELLKLAKDNGVKLLFEAAVAGGIPILKTIEQGLSANKITKVAGIINGTGNFIMTAMRDEGRDFTDVLSEAQKLGYAEADPAFDVEGTDAAHKLAILSSMSFGVNLAFDKVQTIGIGKVSKNDTQFADELGYKIKPLALAINENNKIAMSVFPTLIPKTKLLASVDGVMNAVMVVGNATGETMSYGAGAGSDATASSVIADIIDIANNTCGNGVLGWTNLQNADFATDDEISSEFYLKLSVADVKGVLASVTGILSEFNISIEKMIQKEADSKATIIIITNKVLTKNINNAVAEIEQQDFNKENIQVLHVNNLN
jgi:homoserine dehydrogenase